MMSGIHTNVKLVSCDPSLVRCACRGLVVQPCDPGSQAQPESCPLSYHDALMQLFADLTVLKYVPDAKFSVQVAAGGVPRIVWSDAMLLDAAVQLRPVLQYLGASGLCQLYKGCAVHVRAWDAPLVLHLPGLCESVQCAFDLDGVASALRVAAAAWDVCGVTLWDTTMARFLERPWTLQQHDETALCAMARSIVFPAAALQRCDSVGAKQLWFPLDASATPDEVRGCIVFPSQLVPHPGEDLSIYSRLPYIATGLRVSAGFGFVFAHAPGHSVVYDRLRERHDACAHCVSRWLVWAKAPDRARDCATAAAAAGCVASAFHVAHDKERLRLRKRLQAASNLQPCERQVLDVLKCETGEPRHGFGTAAMLLRRDGHLASKWMALCKHMSMSAAKQLLGSPDSGDLAKAVVTCISILRHSVVASVNTEFPFM